VAAVLAEMITLACASPPQTRFAEGPQTRFAEIIKGEQEASGQNLFSIASVTGPTRFFVNNLRE
jgi:hypothetical protein